jgi:hypothetical protein
MKGKKAQVSVDRCPADLVLFLGWLTEFVTLRFVRLVGNISVWMLPTFRVLPAQL